VTRDNLKKWKKFVLKRLDAWDDLETPQDDSGDEKKDTQKKDHPKTANKKRKPTADEEDDRIYRPEWSCPLCSLVSNKRAGAASGSASTSGVKSPVGTPSKLQWRMSRGGRRSGDSSKRGGRLGSPPT
jgi:hypothetical protein